MFDFLIDILPSDDGSADAAQDAPDSNDDVRFVLFIVWSVSLTEHVLIEIFAFFSQNGAAEVADEDDDEDDEQSNKRRKI
jgi:hypothetical protein